MWLHRYRERHDSGHIELQYEFRLVSGRARGAWLRMVVSAQRAATWWGAGGSACRCTAWAIRLLRDQFHMTLAGGFRCHGDISFFLHQGWLVIWVKVILLPPSLYSPPRLGHQIKWQLTHSRTHRSQSFLTHSGYFLPLFRLLRNS